MADEGEGGQEEQLTRRKTRKSITSGKGRFVDYLLLYADGRGKRKDRPTIKGLTRLMLWEKTWLNPKWRRRWRKKWGKNRWKPALRRKWKNDIEWRRKWMKKLRKNWWNMRWRRNWQKCWIEPYWWNVLEKERKRRKRYWMKKWRTSGARNMRLSFHQFLVIQRRLKALKSVRPGVIQYRRKEKRIERELTIRQKQLKREIFNEERKKHWFFMRRWYHFLFETEHYGPETYGLRPAVIQFKLYLVNSFQGLIAFILVLLLNIFYSNSIRPSMALRGLFFIVYSATALDFFGSIFGMLTSYHLESYYGQRPYMAKKARGKNKCFGCFKPTDKANQEDWAKPSPSISSLDDQASMPSTATLARGITSSNWNLLDWKLYVDRDRGKQYQSRPSNWSNRRGSTSTISTFLMKNRSSQNAARANLPRRESDDVKKKILEAAESIDALKKNRKSEFTNGEKNQCKHRGPQAWYCCFLRKCFRAGKSRKFINAMGYISWIFLQLAWFINILYVVYYSWVKYFSKEYRQLVVQCSILPIQLHCYDFEQLYYYLFAIVVVTFMLRNVFTFFIGMCFNERYLKRIPSSDTAWDIASTDSDTDIDYDKVPRQILIPYLFSISTGRYPYAYPGSAKPRRKIKKELNALIHQEKSKKRAQEKILGREDKPRRRILNAREKEAQTVMRSFKGIRRAHVPLPKGRRKQIKIPLIKGVPDTIQLPLELMTTQARAWLSEEEDSQDEIDPLKKLLRQPRRRRMKRKRGEEVSSTSLIVVHGKDSKIMSVDEAIKEKIYKIDTRLSTDDSWSDDRNIFQQKMAYRGEDTEEPYADDEAQFMQLMLFNEEVRMKRD